MIWPIWAKWASNGSWFARITKKFGKQFVVKNGNYGIWNNLIRSWHSVSQQCLVWNIRWYYLHLSSSLTLIEIGRSHKTDFKPNRKSHVILSVLNSGPGSIGFVTLSMWRVLTPSIGPVVFGMTGLNTVLYIQHYVIWNWYNLVWNISFFNLDLPFEHHEWLTIFLSQQVYQFLPNLLKREMIWSSKCKDFWHQWWWCHRNIGDRALVTIFVRGRQCERHSDILWTSPTCHQNISSPT